MFIKLGIPILLLMAGAMGRPAASQAATDGEGQCDPGSRAWIAVTFEGAGFSAQAERAIVRNLRVDLGWRAIELCLGNPPLPHPPIATVAFSTEDGRHVNITVDASNEQNQPERVSRASDFGSIPADGLELAVATATDELLRVTWLELALKKAQAALDAEAQAAAEAAKKPQPAPTEEPHLRFQVPRMTMQGLHSTAEIGAAALAGFSAGTQTQPASSYGGAARLGVFGPRWGISAGALLPFSSVIDSAPGQTRLVRIPFDTSLRLFWQHNHFSAALDVGPVLAWLRMSEQNLLHPRASSTLELGVRAASTLEWGSEHLRVYGGLTAELVPRPTELFILPQGVVGHAPWLWIGTILGLRLSV